MKLTVVLDTNGRILASSQSHCLVGGIEIDTPEDFDVTQQHNYRTVEGELIFDPLLEAPALPTLEERLAAVEALSLDMLLGGALDA